MWFSVTPEVVWCGWGFGVLRHRRKVVQITYFRASLPGSRHALTFVGENGVVVYAYNLIGGQRLLVRKLEDAGYEVGTVPVLRWFPRLWPERRRE